MSAHLFNYSNSLQFRHVPLESIIHDCHQYEATLKVLANTGENSHSVADSGEIRSIQIS